jgi:hypothetical protein
VTTSRDGWEANNDNHEDNVVVIIATGGRWREAKRGKYAVQMMEMTTMKTTTMEKMTTKKSIPNLLSAPSRSRKGTGTYSTCILGIRLMGVDYLV